MSVDCQSIQQRILETGGRELSEQEARHLATCAECAEVEQAAAQTGALLAAMGREIRRSEAYAPAEALHGRVRQNVLGQLHRQRASAGAVARKAVKEPSGETAGRWLDALREVFRRTHWTAAAAVAAIALVGFLGFRLMAQRPIGRLEFATGPTLLAGASGGAQHHGVGEWACREGATLRTEARSMALFSLGGAVRAAMSPSTAIRVASARTIELKEGSVWLRVMPGGKGFAVQTPAARVTVTGTSFGVTIDKTGATRVEVAEGSVAVSQAAASGKVTAGQTMAAGGQGIENPTDRAEGKQLPSWVEALLGAEKVAHAGNYLPSVNMH